MTIDEAIKHQEEKTEALYKAIPCDGCAFDECVKEHRQLAEWLRELKQLREQTRLIPVSERLPEVTGEYLVTKMWRGSYSGEIYKEVDISTYDKRQRRWDCIDVVAWQPLPSPYKEDKADDEGFGEDYEPQF